MACPPAAGLPGALVVEELKRHRTRQDGQRQEAAEAWREHGLAFTRDDGTMLDPMRVSRRIADLVGHSTPSTTQTVCRHQIRPVIVHGAETMDAVCGTDEPTG